MTRTALIVVAVACMASRSFPQHGVGPLWGAEVPLPKFNASANQRGVLFNNMVVTSTGRIIISTTESNPTNPNQIYGHYLTYSDDGGQHWLTPPRRFTPTDLVSGGSSPKLALDKNDTLYVLWTGVNPAAIFCSKLDANLNVVTDSVRVASAITYNSFATHFTIDRYNRIHVMWHEGNIQGGQIVESYYTRSTNRGRTWGAAQPLSQTPGRHSAFPHAQFDAAGDTLAIGWRDSVGASSKWDVYMVFSTNGGTTWTPASAVVTGNDYDSDPDVVIDAANRIHLLYHKYPTVNPHQDASVRYMYSDNVGASWNLPSVPSSGRLSDTLQRSHLVEGCRYDAQRNVLWVTWKDERDFNYGTGDARADMMVAYSTDRGNTWSVPEFSTDGGDSSLGFKAGALFPSGDYSVNYEMMAPGGNSIRVYFRKRPGVTTSVTGSTSAPTEFRLYQNYPNPFNPTTNIKFQIPSTKLGFGISDLGLVSLKVYDMLGREVRTLVNENLPPGRYEVNFNAEGLPSGVYFYRLHAGTFVQTKKLMLLR